MKCEKTKAYVNWLNRFPQAEEAECLIRENGVREELENYLKYKRAELVISLHLGSSVTITDLCGAFLLAEPESRLHNRLEELYQADENFRDLAYLAERRPELLKQLNVWNFRFVVTGFILNGGNSHQSKWVNTRQLIELGMEMNFTEDWDIPLMRISYFGLKDDDFCSWIADHLDLMENHVKQAVKGSLKVQKNLAPNAAMLWNKISTPWEKIMRKL